MTERENPENMGDKLSTIYKITAAINRADTLEDIYRKAIEGITEVFGVNRASILLFNEDKFMEFKAWKGISDRYRKSVEGHTPWRFGQKNPEPILIEDVASSSELGDYKETILSEGIRAMAFIPITYRSRTIGKFMLYYDKPHKFSREEIITARILAEEIGFAVHQRKLESRLRESGKLLKILFGEAPEGIVLHKEERIVFANDAFAHLLGYGRGVELIGRSVWDFIPEDAELRRRIGDRISMVYRGERVPPLEEKLLRADGGYIFAEVLAAPIVLEGDTFGLVFVRDISERRALIEELQRFKKAVDKSKDMIVITDTEGKIIYVNEAFTQITGYTPQEVLGEKMSILKHGMHSEEFYRLLWDTILSGKEFTTIFTDRKKSGEYFLIYTTITPIKDEKGNIVNFIGIGKDITKERLLEEKLNRAMFYDPITDLPNRSLFIEKLKEALDIVSSKDRYVAVVVMDIDNFSMINDTYGESIGNKILNLVGKRAKDLLRPGDIVSRIGADEFAVALVNVASEDDAILVIKRLIDGFQELFRIGEVEIDISLTMGVAMFPTDAKSAVELMEKADLALTGAKREGLKVKFFHSSLDEDATEFVILTSRLKNAFEREEFYPVYQGIYSYGSDKPIGFEALARWRSEDLGLIPPAKFIPILESTKQMIKFGDWFLPKVREDVEKFIEIYGKDIFVSINLSPLQFEDFSFIRRVSSLFKDLSPNVAFEITENVLARNREKSVRVLEELHGLGFRIHIDDFGTGYSSLEYLKDFPVDGLKIDRSFVMDIMKDEKDLSIVRIIVNLATELNFYTVAEGVETEEQLKLLNALGCDYFQGFYLSKPKAMEELVLS
jgi:diguanylate cyclase (GGDEF)-like protein/PAS domain S-box-containing protein